MGDFDLKNQEKGKIVVTERAASEMKLTWTLVSEKAGRRKERGKKTGEMTG